MSMSGCERCWDTPCTCGWNYRKWSLAQVQSQIEILDKVKNFKVIKPNAKFSDFSEDNTGDDKQFIEFMGA